MSIRNYCLYLLFGLFSLNYAQNNVQIKMGNQSFPVDLPDYGQVTVSPTKGLVQTESFQPDENIRVIVQFEVAPILSKKQARSISKLSSAQRIESQRAKFENDLQNLFSRSVQKFSAYSLESPRVIHTYRHCFSGMALTVPRCMIQSIRDLPSVKQVYMDQKVHKCLEESVPMIGADRVWQTLGLTGEGVMVGIIDTGIDYTHPALGGGFGSGYKVIGGYDICNHDADPMDDNGHGTHVAGIVAGNSEQITGVAPGANLMAFKVLDNEGSGWTSDVIRGIEMAVDPDDDPLTDDGVDVINMSLGHSSRNPEDPDCQAVNTAFEAGVICVVSAGNDGLDGYESIGAPALAHGAIAVGAVEKDRSIAYFSSMGPAGINETIKPDLVAPGVDIASSDLGWLRMTHSGTSMASPHVAGVAALVCEKYPDATPEQIKGILCASAEDLDENFFQQGSGMVQAFRACQLTTSVIPNNLGLGVVDANQDIFTVQKYLSIVNINDQTQSYQLSLRHALPAGVDVNLDRTDITLDSGSQDSILLTMHVNNSMVPQFEEYPGSLEGWMDIISTQDTLAVPFSLLHMPSIQLQFDSKYLHLVLYKISDNYEEAEPRYYNNLESPCNLIIPSGNYDIKAEIFEDGKNCEVYKTLHFEKSMDIQISASDAKYALAAVIDPALQENIKSCYWRRYFLDNKTGIVSVTFHFGNSQIDTLYVSQFDTDRFSMGWIQYVEDVNDNVYLASDGINEPLTENRIIRIDSVHMIPIDFSAAVNPFLTEDLDQMAFESIAYDAGYTVSFNNVNNMPLDNEGRFRLYVTPEDDTPFFFYKFSFSKEDFFEVIDDAYWTAGYLCFQEDRITSSFLEYVLDDSYWGFYENLVETKVFDIPDETAYFGVGLAPSYPRNGIQAGSDYVKIPLNNFCFQAGDYLTSANDIDVGYRLYLDNQLVSEGTTQDSLIQLSGEGPYHIELSYPKIAAFGQYTGDASITADFNTQNNDRNPPQLLDLRLLSDGYLIDPFKIPGQVNLSARLHDEAGIADVDFQYRTSGESSWHDLDVANENELFTAVLPDTLLKSWIDVRVSASDISGNRFVYTLLPAYINQGVTHVTQFTISPDYILPNQNVRLNARVFDADGIQKVEANIFDASGTAIAQIQLFDDGNHQDGKADDHLYAAQWTTPEEAMDFSVKLTTTDQTNHIQEYPLIIHATTRDVPYLTLAHRQIERLPSDNLGALVIQNAGSDTAREVLLQLYDYSYDYVLYEETIESINPGDSINWIPPMTISALIESDEKIIVPISMHTSEFTWHDTLTIHVIGNSGPDIYSPMVYPRNARPNELLHLECEVADGDGIKSVHGYIIDDDKNEVVDSLAFQSGEEDSWGDVLFLGELKMSDLESNFRVMLQAIDSLGNVSFDSTSIKFTTNPEPSGEAEVFILGQFQGAGDETLVSMTEALAAIDISCEIWNRTYRGFCDYMLLQKYLDKAVIWRPDVYEPTEDEIMFDETQPDEEERYKIKRYLDQGGNLMVTQSDFISLVDIYDSDFETRYLLYKKGTAPEPVDQIQGVDGDPIGQGLVLNLCSGTSLDAMKPRYAKYGSAILKTANDDIIAIRTNKDDYRAVVLGFDFKNIVNAEDRELLLDRIIQWFQSPSKIEEDTAPVLPANFALRHNYPNPFNSQTIFPYELPEATEVTIQLFDILGRHVITLINNKTIKAGYHKVKWDGTDQSGKTVSGGIYFCSFKTADYHAVQKCVYIR